MQRVLYAQVNVTLINCTIITGGAHYLVNETENFSADGEERGEPTEESSEEEEEESEEEEEEEEEDPGVRYYLRKRQPVIYQYQPPIIQVHVCVCVCSLCT